MRALGRTPVSVFYQSTGLIYQWAENLPRGLDDAQVLGNSDSDFLPRLAADRLTAAKNRVLETAEPQRFELPVNLGGEVRWFDVWVDPDRNAEGAVIGIFSTLIEMTDQKRREVQLKSLLREVSHRSKNLLAIILSLASQTARSSTSLSGFVAAFSGRLQAIARAQDLVTDRDWHGALLSDLVARQVALFRGDKALPVSVSGDDIVISPNAALYVGLAIHELAANAVKHGQLVSVNGHIDVEARLVSNAEGARSLKLDWIESDGKDGTELEPLTLAFLENVVPLAVEGEGTVVRNEGALRYSLEIDGGHLT
ncbi:sensor histidine kinase [Pelagibacterium xiamenense]|uniref:sensor histidine kinase n=1 Tax=Pelagibacterium xiamenense TaxID=2901140 RepID=UPI001E585703|nr:HWE histidine kinase domain-containing protein [Pelagibacterium xiamenense]MCD7060171.1 PAS domain-containing protein [Pelagibacterium xiamenense]